MFVIEVIAGKVGSKAAVRRSKQVYTVPYERLSSLYQEIHKRGGKIINISPSKTAGKETRRRGKLL